MAMVGYSVTGSDNNSYMYRTWASIQRCDVCHAVLDHTAVNPDFSLSRAVYDFSYTYDRACIISEAAKRVLAAHDGVSVLRLPRDAGFYLLKVRNTLEFDSERRKTRFERFCDGCQRFRSVARATPAFLRGRGRSLPEGVYRTDVEFGSDDDRHPLVIVSIGLRDVLQRESPNGINFKPIEG